MKQLQKQCNTSQAQTPRQVLESKFAGARHNILLVVVFTAINIFLLVTNSNTYFLFSAYIPYMCVDLGMLLCGMYPVEFYTGEFAAMEFLNNSFFAVTLVAACGILLLYLLSWILTKQHKVGWMIFSLVFFCIDTVLMLLLNGIAVEAIMDIVFHGWVIISLIGGISAYYKWKKLPDEILEPAVPVDPETETETPVLQDSPMLRFADEEAKARILLEAEAGGHKIIYRRVKRANELVIDRRVYDEHIALVEAAHTLRACIAGHTIEAGYDGVLHSFIVVDGQTIAKKVRVF